MLLDDSECFFPGCVHFWCDRLVIVYWCIYVLFHEIHTLVTKFFHHWLYQLQLLMLNSGVTF